MPRIPRTKSQMQIYHIMMRGINRQCIFEEAEDSERFIETLYRYRESCGYDVFAYCLMGNHLHLLIKEGKEPIELFMKRLCGSYVYWYNRKYGRVGNLFQDRFKSEPVNDEAHFLTVLRYIYQNPTKAGLASDIDVYPWSNYREFICENEHSHVKDVLSMFHTKRDKAVKEFDEFIRMKNDDACMEASERQQLKDDDAREIIKKVCKINNATELQVFEIRSRNEYLRKLKEKQGLSIRQIERLTGINRGVVMKA